MLSLANKYRPSDFDTTLIGQDHIAHILKYQVAHHTRQANYLFFGIRGTGKTSSARLFAKAINCLQPRDGNPCNECENCKAIQNNETMDIVEIDAASHTGVDNIREEIIDKVGYRPTMLKKKIIIIDEVHMLSKGAFNALLKTMEEPREWMIFILATTELNKVPETIVSRCQVFNFRKVPLHLVAQHLRMIADKESIPAEDDGLAMIAKLSDGSMRDAVKYLDQISVMGGVTAESVGQFLGVVSDVMISEILDKIKQYQTSESSDDFQVLISAIQDLATKGVDLGSFPKQLMHYADEHFASDPAFFASISLLASELLSQSKWYPHPLLLYKTILRGKKEVTESNKRQQEVAGGNKGQQKVEEITDSQSHQPTNSLTPQFTNSPVSIPNAFGTSQFTNSLTPSLQTILDDKCEFEDLSKEVVTLLVINLNAMSKIALNKKENQDLMISTLHTLGHAHIKAIEFKAITPEEYVMRQMG